MDEGASNQSGQWTGLGLVQLSHTVAVTQFWTLVYTRVLEQLTFRSPTELTHTVEGFSLLSFSFGRERGVVTLSGIAFMLATADTHGGP